MNLVKLQKTKLNHRISCILIYKQQKIRKRNQGGNPIYHCNKKNKISRNKPYLRRQKISIQKTIRNDERSQRQHKHMKRYTMFLDWKNQYCENDYSTQSNSQIQCSSYQITNGIFHRTRTKRCNICVETLKTPNSQSNFIILFLN